MGFVGADSMTTQINAETAIALANHTVMATNAWREFFQVDGSFPLDLQAAMTVVASQTYSHAGTAKTMQTYEAVQKMIDGGRSAAESRLRDLVAARYLKQVTNEDNAKIQHWRLYSPVVREKLAKLAALLRIIMEVVQEQLRNPTDPLAGRCLLPSEYKHVYFNIVGNRQERLDPSLVSDVHVEESADVASIL
jgi:hypothetical protein